MALSETFRLIIEATTDKAQSALGALETKASSTATTLKEKLSSGIQGGVQAISDKVPGAGKVLEGLGATAQGTGSTITSALGPAAMAGAAGAIAGFGLKAVEGFQNAARAAEDLSRTSQMTVEDSSRWIAIADDAGVATDQLTAAFGKLSKNADSAALRDLGVQLQYTNTGALDAQGTFLAVADVFHSTDDAATRAKLGTAAFGKSWQDMSRLIDQSAGSIKTSLGEVSRLQTFSDADVKKAQEFYSAMDDLGDTAKGLEVEIGRGLAPALTTLVGVLNQTVTAVDDAGVSVESFGKTNRDSLGWLGDAFGKLFGGSYVDAKNKSDDLTKSQEDLHRVTSRVTKATGESVDLTKVAADNVGVLDQATKDYQKTLADTSAATAATKAHQDHLAALQAVEHEYGPLASLTVENAATTDAALADMASQAGAFRDSMYGAFHDAEGPLFDFKNAASVSADDFIASLQKQRDAAQTWATDLQTAADAGINEGFLEKLASAGPKAQPILSGLLDAVKRGDTDQINQLVQDADTALGQGENAILNHKGEWSAAGTAVGAAFHRAAQSQLDQSFVLPDLYAAAHQGGKDVRASQIGGMSPGGWTWVGEAGPELVDLPSGAYVHTAPDSQRMAAGGATVINQTTVNVHTAASLNPASVVAAMKKYERRHGDWRA